jgi:hypothetical protein
MGEEEGEKEQSQLARLRKAREDAHKERLRLQRKYAKNSTPLPLSSSSPPVSVRSLGNVQRSPTNMSLHKAVVPFQTSPNSNRKEHQEMQQQRAQQRRVQEQRSQEQGVQQPAVRSIGNVQRSPRNISPERRSPISFDSPPHSDRFEQQEHCRKVKVNGHIISSPALRRQSAIGGEGSFDDAVHLEMLRQARIDAHRERMMLKERMEGMGGRPLRRGSSQDTTNIATNTSTTAVAACQPNRVTPSPMTTMNGDHASNNLNPTTDEHHHRKSSSSHRREQAMNEEEKYLERLRQARIQTHQERMALVEKMEGMGGRPTSRHSSPMVEHPEESMIGRRTTSSHNNRSDHVSPPSELIKERAKMDREAREKIHLEQLKHARVAAHQERVALREKMKARSLHLKTPSRERVGSGCSGSDGAMQHSPPISSTSPRSSPAVADAVARGEASRANRTGTGNSKNGSGVRGGCRGKKDGNKEAAYLEQLRLARVEAFEARKALASRNADVRGWATRSDHVNNNRNATPDQHTSATTPIHMSRNVDSRKNSKEGVMRRKMLKKNEEQALHEERLKEARRVAYEERLALEAKMRNGGRTPGR